MVRVPCVPALALLLHCAGTRDFLAHAAAKVHVARKVYSMRNPKLCDSILALAPRAASFEGIRSHVTSWSTCNSCEYGVMQWRDHLMIVPAVGAKPATRCVKQHEVRPCACPTPAPTPPTPAPSPAPTPEIVYTCAQLAVMNPRQRKFVGIRAKWGGWGGCSKTCGRGIKLRAELLQLPIASKNVSRHGAMDILHCRGNVESRPCATAMCPNTLPAATNASNAKLCARISNFSAAAKAFAGINYGHTRWSKCSRSCGGGRRWRTEQLVWQRGASRAPILCPLGVRLDLCGLSPCPTPAPTVVPGLQLPRHCVDSSTGPAIPSMRAAGGCKLYRTLKEGPSVTACDVARRTVTRRRYVGADARANCAKTCELCDHRKAQQRRSFNETHARCSMLEAMPSAQAALFGVKREWSGWSRCTKSCGGGTHRRAKRLVQYKASDNGGENGNGGGSDSSDHRRLGGTDTRNRRLAVEVSCDLGYEEQECNVEPCVCMSLRKLEHDAALMRLMGARRVWKPWGACTRTCGNGTQTRTSALVLGASAQARRKVQLLAMHNQVCTSYQTKTRACIGLLPCDWGSAPKKSSGSSASSFMWWRATARPRTFCARILATGATADTTEVWGVWGKCSHANFTGTQRRTSALLVPHEGRLVRCPHYRAQRRVCHPPTPWPTTAPSPPPTFVPTQTPTPRPSAVPSLSPTPVPVASPTPVPTSVPTRQPTRAPTKAPSPAPTRIPVPKPTPRPTPQPLPADDDDDGNTSTSGIKSVAKPATAPPKLPPVAPHSIAAKHCPRTWTPAGGMTVVGALQGCCVLAAARDIAQTLYLMQQCGFSSGLGIGGKIWRETERPWLRRMCGAIARPRPGTRRAWPDVTEVAVRCCSTGQGVARCAKLLRSFKSSNMAKQVQWAQNAEAQEHTCIEVRRAAASATRQKHLPLAVRAHILATARTVCAKAEHTMMQLVRFLHGVAKELYAEGPYGHGTSADQQQTKASRSMLSATASLQQLDVLLARSGHLPSSGA